VRDVKAVVERDEATLERRKPKNLPTLCHGEDTLGIRPEQYMRRNGLHGPNFNSPSAIFNLRFK
jgi:hypothetical protein